MNPSESLYKSQAGQQAVMALYDRVLDAWPAPYEALRVATRFGETFVLANGDPSAPALVLLHGACSNALAWIGDIPAFSRQFRTYAVDVIGEPGRSAAARLPWEGPGYADWLGDVLDGLEAGRALVVGISQGGYMALKLAVHQGDRVAKLVLLAPGGIAQPRASFLLRAIPLSFAGRWGAEAINRITFGDQPIAEEAVRFMNVIMTHFRPRIGAQPLFTDAELSGLTMPVLLVAGARDALMPTEQIAIRLQHLAPQTSVRILPEAGHVLHNLAREIIPFLTSDTRS